MTIEDLQKLPHKKGVNPNDWFSVADDLAKIAEFVCHYAFTMNLPILFTSIIRPKIKGVSKSKTHEEGRAFDISVRGWPKKYILELVKMVNEAFSVGAISASDGVEREAVYEDGVSAGTAPHIHFQVRKLNA